MDDSLEMKKDVLQEIMGLMTKMGYDKMKKPSSIKIEMDQVEGLGPQSAKEVNPMDVEKPFGSEDVSAPEAEDDDEIKKRMMSRFGK